MKKLFIILISLVFGSLFGCKDMDETYKDFIVPGGLEYVGKPNEVKAHPGKNRILLTWLKGADPKIIKTRVYWNSYRDSVEVSITPEMDSVKVLIENLEEQNYSFFFRSFDSDGNISVPLEVMTRVYGERYEMNLLNRGLNRLEINNSGKVSLDWGLANTASGAYATEVLYTSLDGKQKTKSFPAKENTSVIEDFKLGDPLNFRMVYLPDTLAIDTFYTEYDVGGQFSFDKEDWKILEFSSEHPGGDNAAKNLIDGTEGTRWHSWAGNSSYPHFITIDLGAEHLISEIGLWRTTFENGGDTRGPNKFKLLFSKDNITWTDTGEYNFDRNLGGEQIYPISGETRGRYLKLIATEGPENNLVLGELSVYGF